MTDPEIVRVEVFEYASQHHLRCASALARKAAAIESEWTAKHAADFALVPDAVRVDHRAAATAAVLLSVAYLEAAINEHLFRVRDHARRWHVVEGRKADDPPEPRLHLRLRSCGFALNPLAPDGHPFVTNAALGYGCAKWAVETATAVGDAFHGGTGLLNSIDDIRGELVC